MVPRNSWSSHPVEAVIHVRIRLPHKRFLVRCSSPLVRLAQHLTALRAWCKQYLPGRGKSDVFRPGHCWDARVYDHTATAYAWYRVPPLPLYFLLANACPIRLLFLIPSPSSPPHQSLCSRSSAPLACPACCT